MRKQTKKRMPKGSKSTGRAFVSDISLFDESEGTFMDNRQRRRVYVHLIPAPWSRVILLSLVYAMAVAFVKVAWFHIYGRPDWAQLDPAIDPPGITREVYKQQ